MTPTVIVSARWSNSRPPGPSNVELEASCKFVLPSNQLIERSDYQTLVCSCGCPTYDKRKKNRFPCCVHCSARCCSSASIPYLIVGCWIRSSSKTSSRIEPKQVTVS